MLHSQAFPKPGILSGTLQQSEQDRTDPVYTMQVFLLQAFPWYLRRESQIVETASRVKWVVEEAHGPNVTGLPLIVHSTKSLQHKIGSGSFGSMIINGNGKRKQKNDSKRYDLRAKTSGEEPLWPGRSSIAIADSTY